MGNGVTTDSIKLTRAQKKEAKEAKKAEEKRLAAERKAQAEELAIRLSGESDATKKGGVRSDVKNDLKEMYKNGEIDKELYKEAKKYSGKGNIFGRIFGKKKDSTTVFAAQATENKIEKIKTEGPDFGKKLQKKIDAAGLTNEELYDIMERNVGSDNTVSYSWKKRQPGEADAIKAELNSEKYNGTETEFSKKEGKKIAKELGYNVEKAVNGGKVARDAALGAAAGAPLGFVNITQTVNPSGGAITGTISQSVKVGPFGAIAGAVIGGTASAITQATRVEKKVAEKVLPENVKTYNDYAEYMDNYGTEKGADIMKKISKFYVGQDGQTLDKKAMESDLQRAAGEGSVLNYEEAVALHGELVKKPKEEPIKEEPIKEETPEKCQITETDETHDVEVPLATDCYTVKKGDNWDALVRGKYAPKTNEDRKALIRFLKDAAFEDMKKNGTLPAGVKSSRDAFFPKVGEELCIPSEITVNGNTYEYKQDGKVQAGVVSGKARTYVYNQASNPFTKQDKETTYGYETSCGDSVSGLDKNTRDQKVKELVSSGKYELTK